MWHFSITNLKQKSSFSKTIISTRHDTPCMWGTHCKSCLTFVNIASGVQYWSTFQPCVVFAGSILGYMFRENRITFIPLILCPPCFGRPLIIVCVSGLRAIRSLIFARLNEVHIPANTKHLYNICATSAHRLRLWSNIVRGLWRYQ